ncbi:Hypothetical predicted protein [Podarcis lilfordi]|uniref:Uncharacterized protein n=1 Tax=Podarcis lilfordi TaxID=74358 RepID=A0AA35LJ37_9SAUR|nr:Hypothetical predicted protein [Podarcis lilfordi]
MLLRRWVARSGLALPFSGRCKCGLVVTCPPGVFSGMTRPRLETLSGWDRQEDPLGAGAGAESNHSRLCPLQTMMRLCSGAGLEVQGPPSGTRPPASLCHLASSWGLSLAHLIWVRHQAPRPKHKGEVPLLLSPPSSPTSLLLCQGLWVSEGRSVGVARSCPACRHRGSKCWGSSPFFGFLSSHFQAMQLRGEGEPSSRPGDAGGSQRVGRQGRSQQAACPSVGTQPFGVLPIGWWVWWACPPRPSLFLCGCELSGAPLGLRLLYAKPLCRQLQEVFCKILGGPVALPPAACRASVLPSLLAS